MAFEIRFRTMLRGMVALRLRQLRWTIAEWAWVIGLVPPSGNLGDRISFVYIYALIIALMTPSALNVIGGLYAAEAKTSPVLQIKILQVTIPALIALYSLLMIIIPWRAWLLRLTFGDITYLASSPFDRRVLAVWRYLEMLLTLILFAFLPWILFAPMLGSIWAGDVIPNVLRGVLAIGLWTAPVLALGWHISMPQYKHDALPSGVYLITRLGLVVVAGVIVLTKPDLLLWPGRAILLMATDKAAGLGLWPLFVAYSLVGIVIVWRVGRHISLTRASAASDVFARIQQAGVMIVLNRQLLFSILSDSRTNQGSIAGTLPDVKGLAMVFARAALHYRRHYGQAAQFFLAGMGLALSLIVWRPTDIALVIVTAVLLTWQVSPWMARLFRRDLSVPFISQFIPQSLIQRLLLSSVIPVALVLAGMLPVLLVFGVWMPDWAWGIVPLVWVLSLVGHVEVVGKGTTVSERSLFSLAFGSIAVFVMILGATATNTTGIVGLGQSIGIATGVSLFLVFFANVRHQGWEQLAASQNTGKASNRG